MRRVITAAVSTIAGLIMLLSFKTHAAPTSLAAPPAIVRGTSPDTTAPAGSASGSAAASTSSPGATTSGSSTTSTTVGTVTVTGSAASTKYGPVQVQVTVTNGHITAVDAVEYPTQSGRDRQINARAIPILDQETVSAQSANIDMVSGATYTSKGYITSLQSALNQAGL